METFLSIGMYSVFLLGGLTLAAAAFIYVSLWIVDQSEDSEAH